MNSSRRDFFRRLTRGVAGAAVGGAVLTGCRKNSETDENPYAYDLSGLKKVDPALILYDALPPIAVHISKPAAMAVSDDHTIFVGGSEAVVQYAGTGERLMEFETAAPVRAMAIDAGGKLYLGMADHVAVRAAGGALLQSWQPLNRQAVITSIVCSGDSVLVADAGNKRVYRFGRDGAFINPVDAPKPGFVVPSPFFDLAVDAAGSVWVVNPGKHRISKLGAGDTLTDTWGETSHRIAGFSGCCNPTHLAVLPNGDFVTSEKGLPRVKVYDPQGHFRGVVAEPAQFDEDLAGSDLATDSAGRIYVLDAVRKQIRRFQKKAGTA